MHRRGMARVLVLGGGYAGMLAAARVARRGNAAVTLIDQRAGFVQRIRLHEALAGATVPTLAYGPALARRGIRFAQARVVGIDPARQAVQVAADGAEQRLGYDYLIVALGSFATARVPGAADYTLRLDDPQAIGQASGSLRRLASSGGHALVVGGGLTGIETAAELAGQLPGLRVTLMAGESFGQGYSAAAARYLRASLAGLGVQLYESGRVVAMEPGRAWLDSGAPLAYDACVWAGGFAAPALLAEAGLPTDAQGRAMVTPALHIGGNPTLFVAGDSAAAGDEGRAVRMGCVTALPLGTHAGENVAAALAGSPLRPFSFGFPGRNISLGRRAGLVQFTDRRDRPIARIVTGMAAATVKELVCRMTLEAVRGELRTGLPLYHWLGGDGWWAAAARAA